MPTPSADARAIARILTAGGHSYRSSKDLFKEARALAGLVRERDRRGTVERLTEAEAERFTEAAYEADGQKGLMLQTLLETGLRVSEFVALAVDDVAFVERTIVVQSGKGGKRREVPMRRELAQALRVHAGRRSRGPLFMTSRLGHYSARRVQQIVKEVAESAGIGRPVHPHLLRHTAAMHLRRRGVPVDVIQEVFGHESPATTQLYYGADPARARQAIDGAFAS